MKEENYIDNECTGDMNRFYKTRGKSGVYSSIFLMKDYIKQKHWHEEYELLYVINGYVDISIEKEIYRVHPNEIFIISSGVVHYYEEGCKTVDICVVRFSRDLLKCFSDSVQNLLIHFLSDVLHIFSDQNMGRIMRDLMKSIEAEDSLEFESIMTINIHKLLFHMYKESDIVYERIPVRRNQNSETINNMILFINEHVNEKITLKDVASHFGFSDSYCSRYIKEKTGMTFVELVNNQRIERAKQILRTTDVPITDIVFRTGFSSIQSFNRVFKKFCGINPSSYRSSREKPMISGEGDLFRRKIRQKK